MTRTAALIALLALLPQAARGQDRMAPPLSLRTVEGRSLRLSDYRGKVVLLNFWATWCPPCRAEMPDLVKLQREYGPQGLQVIGVTYPPERRARVRRFTRRLKVNYPVALGTRQTKAIFSADVTLPLTVIIDRGGTIRGFIAGILLPEEFEQQVKPLLRPDPEGGSKNEGKTNRPRGRLRAAGLVGVETSLEPAPAILSSADEFREFLTRVNMHAHLARLPEGRLRRRFIEQLTEQAAADDPPYSLDYCRLNIRAPPRSRLKRGRVFLSPAA